MRLKMAILAWTSGSDALRAPCPQGNRMNAIVVNS
jgi:hypothetical protein